MSSGSTASVFLGIQSAMPVFISPAAMAKLGHPLGEVNLTKAAGEYGVAQAVRCDCTNLCRVFHIYEHHPLS